MKEIYSYRLRFVLIAFFLFSCSIAWSQAQDWSFYLYDHTYKKDSLHIASVEVTQVHVDCSTGVAEFYDKEKYIYDSKGRWAAIIYTNKRASDTGTYQSVRCWSFNEYGNTMEERWYDDEDTSIVRSSEKYSYQYNAEHKPVQYKRIYSEESRNPHDSSQTNYTYDKRGNMLTEEVWIRGEWGHTRHCSYNNNNQLVKETTSSNRYKESRSYRYVKGKLMVVKRSLKGSPGCAVVPDKKVYAYDSLGRLKTRWEYYGHSMRKGLSIYKIEYLYKTGNEPVSITVSITDSGIYKDASPYWWYMTELLEYNDRGLPITRILYWNNRKYFEISTLEYEYR